MPTAKYPNRAIMKRIQQRISVQPLQGNETFADRNSTKTIEVEVNPFLVKRQKQADGSVTKCCIYRSCSSSVRKRMDVKDN